MSGGREIQFRLWNPTANEFTYWGFLGGDHGFSGIATGTRVMTIAYARKNSEQYTGRNDKKNGTKIFEGDVVRHENGFLYVVEWADINACWCLVQIRTIHGETVPYTGGINGQDIWRCEVVGNIHAGLKAMK